MPNKPMNDIGRSAKTANAVIRILQAIAVLGSAFLMAKCDLLGRLGF